MATYRFAAVLLLVGGCSPAETTNGEAWPITSTIASHPSPASRAIAQAPAVQAVERTIVLKSSQVESVKRGVKKALKDPESARFDSLRAGVDKDQVTVVCGLVNARNAYGGYTGPQPFMGVLMSVGIFVPVAVGGDRTAQEVTASACSQMGL